MENRVYDRDKIQECLQMHLQDKLESAWAGGIPGGGGRISETDRAMALDRYQHRIWQLKDRLSCQVYGPHTQGLVDEFMHKFDIQADRSSKEYLWIVRMVLQTEIRYYTILMQGLNAENDEECLFQRKVSGRQEKTPREGA